MNSLLLSDAKSRISFTSAAGASLEPQSKGLTELGMVTSVRSKTESTGHDNDVFCAIKDYQRVPAPRTQELHAVSNRGVVEGVAGRCIEVPKKGARVEQYARRKCNASNALVLSSAPHRNVVFHHFLAFLAFLDVSQCRKPACARKGTRRDDRPRMFRQ
jgi:hypothetical protein